MDSRHRDLISHPRTTKLVPLSRKFAKIPINTLFEACSYSTAILNISQQLVMNDCHFDQILYKHLKANITSCRTQLVSTWPSLFRKCCTLL